MRLKAHGGVAARLEMLEYYRCMLRFRADPRLALNLDAHLEMALFQEKDDRRM